MRLAQYKTIKGQKVTLLPEFSIKLKNNPTFLSPDKVYQFMTKHPKIRIHKNTCEYLYMLCLDKQGHPTALFELSKGTVDRHVASPRDAILNAVLTNSVNVILVHNHPSGVSTPSESDKELTKGFAKAFQVCDMSLIDHLIIGQNTYTSLRHMNPELWS